jgi:hypothetical protein
MGGLAGAGKRGITSTPSINGDGRSRLRPLGDRLTGDSLE